jgi:hypothetical protein
VLGCLCFSDPVILRAMCYESLVRYCVLLAGGTQPERAGFLFLYVLVTLSYATVMFVCLET